ncbi:putative inner membrane protein DUF1819 [Orenia metallireducens]|jgi:K+ transporter|uniref:Putative inner membrane protein n=1 Tax=Orenia metallireducens TaxID=1413210 RepID=A0A285HTG5_9FIRM|nr:DUF1819 family protein [Orenia metallireducens]PRX24091.1 putative inner membrane protein DUF1819 [Orenia metallireducens]SNY39028.1 Putative inner membrane protein [Orenia metallireducens]
MKKKKKYSTGIKSTPFLYLELKKIAKLKVRNSNITDKEIRRQAVEDNIFQVNTLNRRKTISRATIKRINVLDDYLIDQLLNGTLDNSKQIALYSILKTDRLFFEFMKEVYREKYLIKDPYLHDKDFNIFFEKKAEQSERVAGWKEYTYYKLKQVFIRILFEAGFIKEQDKREIVRPIINQSLKQHLIDKNEAEYLEAMLG